MQRFLLTIDKITTWFGQLFAWTIVALTALIGFEVVSRYVFNSPHPWVFDGQMMLYGVMFMMAGAYTLSKNGHVRGDVLYGFFTPRTQATIDMVVAPGVNTFATPSCSSWGMSSSGMIPPPKTTTSSAPRS